MDTIPWTVMDNDGNMRTDKDFVLDRWKTDFEELLNENANQSFVNNGDTDYNQRDVSTLNEPITREEITSAVENAKLRKASGFDEKPAEVIKSPTAFELLYIICNGCFELGKVPDQWTTSIINPIFKPGSEDRKIPLNYRGIKLISVPSKIYCHVLNIRLNSWLDVNKVLCERNGFREKRSSEVHIHTLHTVINDRKIAIYVCLL
ncbi:unnamed protein product [Mytilus coruscus]|uniref:Reverse transcriptase domain-containing protein n=1 Tax=Mytilus coruscus TaxID=42192 RepID=A0A6J8DAW5_MYTCO|nr:unnamed protein product [Mytilus coruscus]